MYQTSLRLHNVSNHTHNTCQTPLRLHIKSLSDYISNPTQTIHVYQSHSHYISNATQTTYQTQLRLNIKLHSDYISNAKQDYIWNPTETTYQISDYISNPTQNIYQKGDGY